jgi:hypothetical protein
MKKTLIYLVLAIALLLGMVAVRSNLSYRAPIVTKSPVQSTITYPGQTGKNALDLLNQHHVVKTDASGMVVGIDTRTINSAKHEYWAFYINGKMASIGPKEYQTKSTDQIAWKVETY